MGIGEEDMAGGHKTYETVLAPFGNLMLPPLDAS